MGRPPCCDKVGIKKGPWTPEEDIILVSYIQEHGPGNWRAVPTNTGLMRCSKSCRLRWTNYLRPGIKRGNFTPHEEGMIIHLQALLGNKWAAIATYLPQRTDNDIKNYWNTHLKKKLKKFQSGNNMEPQTPCDPTSYHQFMSKSIGNTSDLRIITETSSVYASSEENISRLLEGWMRTSSSSVSSLQVNTPVPKVDHDHREFRKTPGELIQNYRPLHDESHTSNGILNHDHELESILSFDQHHGHNLIVNSSCDSSQKGSDCSGLMDLEQKPKIDNNPPLSFLEKWLLDESAGQVEGVMEVPPIF